MHWKKWGALTWLLVLITALLVSVVAAQTPPQQTEENILSSAIADTSGGQVDGVVLDGDIELEEIKIDAILEKPRVSILPKRIDPEFGELEFVDRSFDKELKAVPQKLMIEDDRLFQPQKIKRMKQKENAAPKTIK